VRGDTAVVSELQIELALAPRKLDAGSDNGGIGLGRSGVGNSLVVRGLEAIQAIDAAVHVGWHL
jgi:hypothetical protein